MLMIKCCASCDYFEEQEKGKYTGGLEKCSYLNAPVAPEWGGNCDHWDWTKKEDDGK